jgi:hypothetical protein
VIEKYDEGREAVQAGECYRLEKAMQIKIYRIQITLFPTAAATFAHISFHLPACTGLHFFSLAFNGHCCQIYTETGIYQKRDSVFRPKDRHERFAGNALIFSQSISGIFN